MFPRPKWLVPEVSLIHKLLNMHNHMHHHVEALNAVVKVETTFLEHFAPNTPSIQLCEGVSSPAPNETVAVITLGTPFGEVSCFGFGVGDRTMGTSWKPPIKENGLFCFVLLCICMHPSCPVTLK